MISTFLRWLLQSLSGLLFPPKCPNCETWKHMHDQEREEKLNIQVSLLKVLRVPGTELAQPQLMTGNPQHVQRIPKSWAQKKSELEAKSRREAIEQKIKDEIKAGHLDQNAQIEEDTKEIGSV